MKVETSVVAMLPEKEQRKLDDGRCRGSMGMRAERCERERCGTATAREGFAFRE